MNLNPLLVITPHRNHIFEIKKNRVILIILIYHKIMNIISNSIKYNHYIYLIIYNILNQLLLFKIMINSVIFIFILLLFILCYIHYIFIIILLIILLIIILLIY